MSGVWKGSFAKKNPHQKENTMNVHNIQEVTIFDEEAMIIPRIYQH